MRGVHDGAMNGAKTIEEQKAVLTKVLKDQRDLLTKYVLSLIHISLYGKTLPLQLIHPTFYLSFADDDTRRDVPVGNYSIDAAGNDIAVPYRCV